MLHTAGMLYRDRRLFVRSLGALLLLLVLTAAGCLGIIAAITGVETNTSATLWVTVYNEDQDSRLGTVILKTASRNEIVTQIMDITLCESREEARACVEEGGAAAAVIIPEDFFSQASHGKSLPCQILLNTAGQSAAATLTRYLSVGSQILTSSQQLVFAGDDYMRQTGADQETADSVNLYMNLYALGTLETYEDKAIVRLTLPYTRSGLGAAAYYTALYTAFGLSLLILAFYSLYRRDMTRGTLSRLLSGGIREPDFFLWKWLLPCLLETALLFVLMFASRIRLAWHISAASLLQGFLAVLFLTGLGMMVSCAFSRSSGIIWFILQTSGLFLCGGLIPYSRLAPLGVSVELLSPLLGGRSAVWAPFLAVLYLAAGALLTHRAFRRCLISEEVFS